MVTSGRADRVRLHVVSGKGGTGKTTVAAALALALASGGARVLLCEVEGRQGIARLFDVPPLPYEERSIAVAPGGGEVLALAIEAEAALLEYLDMYYRLGRAGKALDRFGIIDFATTIAPGVRDVLLTGKVYEAARRRDRQGEPRYDAIVLDAPPTGRITRFLNVNREVAGLAKAGPIRNQADAIMTLLRSRHTAVHLVTVLEDMPVQETVDGICGLRAAGLPVGRVMINMVRSSPLPEPAQRAVSAGLVAADALDRSLGKAGLDVTPGLADALLEETAHHLQRLALEEEQRAKLVALDVPHIVLPQLYDGVDLGGLYDLARQLRQQGLS
ncbi:MAG: ArsA-related P-loop ATPase [Nocardioidaceae bacterium]